MPFNSLAFLIFLPLFFAAYWSLRRLHYRWQNLLLVLGGYLFYAWWDWRFVPLLAGISLVDYLVGRGLAKTEAPGGRKLLLAASLLVNLGALFVFKYFDFFVSGFADILRLFGLRANPAVLRFILPIGLAFYTLKTLSYTLDVYRRKLEPTRDPIAYLAFVSFFPHLLAGPIERAKHFLPQLESRRTFDADEAADGLRQMLWGFAKKVLVADLAARAVNNVFLAYGAQDTPALLAGVFLFAVQLYGDFSGYSDMAVGTARLLGFRSVRNFAYPYFARNIAEFWRRWHMSLMSWLRDYIFYPLGGPLKGKGRWIVNTLVVFLISGLWHGADWTFIIWGLLNGVYFIPLILKKEPPVTKGIAGGKRWYPSLKEAARMAGTFLLVCLGWVFFRADSLPQALGYLEGIFVHPSFGGVTHGYLKAPLIAAVGLLLVEWFQRRRRHALRLKGWPRWARWAAYYAVALLLILFGAYGNLEFIYFQF